MRSTALQIARTGDGFIEPNANVRFDTTLYTSGDIRYDNETGIATILQPGQYIFNWWVSVQHPPETETAFVLITSQGYKEASSPPLLSGERIGFSVLDVAVAPMNIFLCNTGTEIFAYRADTPVKAALLIVRDDFSGPDIPPAYGGVCSDAAQMLSLPSGGGTRRVALPAAMPSKAVTLAENSIRIDTAGDYEIHYYIRVHAASAASKVSAGVRINGADRFILESVQTRTPAAGADYQKTVIAPLAAGDVLDVAVFCTQAAKVELEGQMNAFLIVKKLGD